MYFIVLKLPQRNTFKGDDNIKILFVHHKLNASFIKNDLEILCKHYEVEDFYYAPKKSLQLFKKIKE